MRALVSAWRGTSAPLWPARARGKGPGAARAVPPRRRPHRSSVADLAQMGSQLQRHDSCPVTAPDTSLSLPLETQAFHSRPWFRDVAVPPSSLRGPRRRADSDTKGGDDYFVHGRPDRRRSGRLVFGAGARSRPEGPEPVFHLFGRHPGLGVTLPDARVRANGARTDAHRPSSHLRRHAGPESRAPRWRDPAPCGVRATQGESPDAPPKTMSCATLRRRRSGRHAAAGTCPPGRNRRSSSPMSSARERLWADQAAGRYW